MLHEKVVNRKFKLQNYKEQYRGLHDSLRRSRWISRCICSGKAGVAVESAQQPDFEASYGNVVSAPAKV